MAFLFKSKKTNAPAGSTQQASRKLSSRDGTSGAPPSGLSNDDEKFKIGPPPQPGALAPRMTGSPTPADLSLRGARTGPQTSQQRINAQDASLYPWSTHSLQFVANSNPFPRYGAAFNATASKEGDVYMMGGLIEGSTVKGDLWIIEAGSLPISCYPVPTTSEGPGPRVGHASLLVGNAFIVFGGDTKVDEYDVLDDTLYLLNTSSKHWSRALPAGPRPAGRYGHTLNILGSKIYVFGGQVEGYFFNDLAAFDLNSLQASTNHWEMLIQNTADGGPPQGPVPPARTNHSVITYNEKLYLFGGTDGVNWFNDVWTYDPRTNSWSQADCIGFIPVAREGHAAALVGDVMYVFGGRTHEGKDLGDVAGFRIPTSRWYTFQNMGPSPSPRSGHGMTAFGSQIFILGGEPSSAPRNPAELSETYVLDTSKIRYPDEKPVTKSSGARRPSVTDRSASGTPQERDRSTSQDGSVNGSTLRTRGSEESMNSTTGQYQRNQEIASSTGPMTNGVPQKPTRSAPSPAPAAPPPQQPRANGIKAPILGAMEGGRQSPRTVQRYDRVPGSDVTGSKESFQAPIMRDQSSPSGSNHIAGSHSPAKAPQTAESYATSNRALTETPEQAARSSGEELIQSTFKQQQYADSGVGSSPALSQQIAHQQSTSQSSSSQQNESIQKELEAMRTKNAWYASELALARKAGYRSSGSLESPVSISDDKAAEAFGDDEKPMLEALIRMRSELSKMQESLNTQGATAAAKIAQAEKAKESALSEAFYAKAKLATRDDAREINFEDSARSDESGRRLASALAAQSELSAQIKALTRDLESEREARRTAEQSADVAHTRAVDLDTHKQNSTSELERLKAELYQAQKIARGESTNHAEAKSSVQILEVEKKELTQKLTTAQENARNHSTVLKSLQEAVNASSEKASLLERQIERERDQRASSEDKLAKLRSEHESRIAELDSTSIRLRDAEELAERHAKEAQTHRDALLAGFGQETQRELPGSDLTDERVSVLQQRLEEANTLARTNQETADRASERQRRAEERIAGLEAYQEQISREGLSLRKQLQSVTKEHLDLRSDNNELQQQLSTHKLDARALQVQHDTLKKVLTERGVDSTNLSRTPHTDAASADRLKALEEQLEVSTKSHEEMRQAFEQREQEANKGWEAKLQALDNDYQSAVRYLKGTEKMLGKMKQELHRYKSSNKELEDELAKERSGTVSRDAASSSWESEKASLRQEVEKLRGSAEESRAQLEKQMQELQAAIAERDSYRETSVQHQRDLAAATERSRGDLATLRSRNEELEARAAEAERQVQMLLDTVGTSVANYRRQSQQGAPTNGTAALAAATAASGHSRGISVNSVGGASVSSTGAGAGGDGEASDVDFSRNSIALDSLANELETLRSQWETTSRNYRQSDQSDLPTPTGAAAQDDPAAPAGLSDWRRRLELDDADDDDDDDDRPTLLTQQR